MLIQGYCLSCKNRERFPLRIVPVDVDFRECVECSHLPEVDVKMQRHPAQTRIWDW